MPNIAFTQYVITGDKKKVKSLYDKMKRLEDRPRPLVENNGYGNRWLGCLVKRLGGNPNKVYCRGKWTNLTLEGENVLWFDTETAWGRMVEFDEFLQKKYPDLKLYFCEDEDDYGVIHSNDAKKLFFKETVIIDLEDEGQETYTEEEAVKKISEIAGRPMKDWQEAKRYVSDHNDLADANGTDDHIRISETEYV